MSRPLTHLKKTRGNQALCNAPSKRFSEIPTCSICLALERCAESRKTILPKERT